MIAIFMLEYNYKMTLFHRWQTKINSSKKIFFQNYYYVLGIYFLLGIFYTGEEDIWDYLAITGSVYFSGAISLVVFGYIQNLNKYGAYGFIAGVNSFRTISFKSFFNIVFHQKFES